MNIDLDTSIATHDISYKQIPDDDARLSSKTDWKRGTIIGMSVGQQEQSAAILRARTGRINIANIAQIRFANSAAIGTLRGSPEAPIKYTLSNCLGEIKEIKTHFDGRVIVLCNRQYCKNHPNYDRRRQRFIRHAQSEFRVFYRGKAACPCSAASGTRDRASCGGARCHRNQSGKPGTHVDRSRIILWRSLGPWNFSRGEPRSRAP